MECLSEVNAAGKTVLIVTHSEKIAAQCKNRVDIEDGVLFTSPQ